MMKPLLLTLSAFLLTACSSSNDDLQQWMNTESATMKGKVTPLPPVAPFVPIIYLGRDLSDPFAPKKTHNKPTAAAPDEHRKKDFLETFPLDRLSIVGTVQRKGILWALIKAPDGTVTMVKPGDYMGINFGKIISIKESGLLLKESVLDPEGDWIDRQVELAFN